jgi:Flp pilus assembly protein TadD
LQRAIAHWKKAFQQDPEVQSLIVDSFASQLPAEEFVATFGASSAVLEQLFEHYRAKTRTADARFVVERWFERLAAVSEKIPEWKAAGEWHRASAAFAWLGDAQRSLDCEIEAVKLTPNDAGMRRILAAKYLENQQFADAIDQLNWCLLRSPRDAQLRTDLANAKLGHEQAARTARQPLRDAGTY